MARWPISVRSGVEETFVRHPNNATGLTIKPTDLDDKPLFELKDKSGRNGNVV